MVDSKKRGEVGKEWIEKNISSIIPGYHQNVPEKAKKEGGGGKCAEMVGESLAGELSLTMSFADLLFSMREEQELKTRKKGRGKGKKERAGLAGCPPRVNRGKRSK